MLHKKKLVWSHKQIKNSEIDQDTIFLSSRDIDHRNRIYNSQSIKQESLNSVTINFLLDKECLSTYIVKEADTVLKVGGLLVINKTHNLVHGDYVRSDSQVLFDVSTATNGRYLLKSKEICKSVLKLTYIKNESTLPENDTINSWSFGIITCGTKPKVVSKLIDSIIKQNIPNFEVIVCGKYVPNKNQSIHIKILADVKNADLRIPITRKKNKIIENAKFNNLLILHDRYELHDNWYKYMCKYGNFFELLSMPNIGNRGGRVSDWNVFSKFPSDLSRFDFLLPEYEKWSKYWYCQGGVLLGKKHLLDSCNLDNNLHWGELEDVQFSQICKLKGLFYYFDTDNYFKTNSERLPESKFSDSFLLKYLRLIKSLFMYFKTWLINFVNYNMNKYLL